MADNKSLNDKAIDIKGKQYVLVSDRIIYFNETYKNGFIQSELLSEPDAVMVIVKTTVTPDTENPERKFTGFSQAKWGDGYINKASALENCETSAVGRALGMMGIGVIDSVASVDEINKAGLPQQSAPVNEELTELKQQVFTALKAKGITELEKIKAYLEEKIGKDSIVNVTQAKVVLKALQGETNEAN